MQHGMNRFGQPIGIALPHWKPVEFPSNEPMNGRFCRVELLNPSLHAPSLYEADSIDVAGKMWTYLPHGPFESLDDYRSWLEEMTCNQHSMFFAIIDPATLRAIGVASYLRIFPDVGSIEVGNLAYSPLLQRTPAATEAMFLMMQRAFSQGYRRYEWKCNALNAPSRSAAARLGFSFEGIFRQAAIVKGCNRDTAWFSIIDTEWPTIQNSFERWLDPSNFDERGQQRLRLSEMLLILY